MEVSTTIVYSYQLQSIDTENPNQNPTEVSDCNCLLQTTEKLVENKNARNTYDEVYQEAKINKLEIERNNRKNSLQQGA